MTQVYRSICMEIDELTIKIIHLSEKLITYKLEVEKIMNNGFVNIAKARYIMGSKCVSTLQLPTMNSHPIRPLATVCRAPCEGRWAFQISRRKPSPLPSDEKLLKDKIKNDTTRADFINDLLEKDSRKIRKRKEFYVLEDENYKELNEKLQDELSTESSESDESNVSFTDPIRLFGVLVPHTLRVAQQNFQEVINVILQCAAIQSETDMVLERYCHLRNVKQLIEAAAKEKGLDLTEEKEYWTPSENDSESSVFVTKADSMHSKSEEDEFKVQEKDEVVTSEIEFEMEGEGQKITPAKSMENFKCSECAEDFNSESLEKSDTSSQ